MMKLGRIEWWLMNNPLRTMLQRHLEARQLLNMGGPQTDATVLEIGCGNGHGIELILEGFGAGRVHGFDLDARMVRRAADRHSRKSRNVRLWVGDTSVIPVGDETYDAVFDFGVLHHIVDWASALKEVYRVLKPGGRFYVEEITREFIVHPVWRRILDHPRKNRFDHDDLMAALHESGFTVRSSRQFAKLFIWCVADRCG